MKKTGIIIVLTILCMLGTAAYADPSITDGVTTGWIGDHGYLYLQSADGITGQMLIEMEDLLQMTDDELFCLTRDQRIIAVKKDRTGSRTVPNEETETQQEQRMKLEEGILVFDGEQVSTTGCAAAYDPSFLYYVERNELTWRIQVKPLTSAAEKPVLAGTREAHALALADMAVNEPLSLTVTREALTLTDADHKVKVMNLLTGEVTEYAATSEETAAACMVNGTLYRYRLTEDRKWEPETIAVVATATPAPTPTATLQPAPTPTPKVTAAPDNQNDSNGTIYRGASGSTVRKIQKRLQELGYPVGNVDGKYGEQTQLAINLFCDAIHVREHEYITAKIQKKLFAKDAPAYDPYLPLKKGDRGVSVLYMQKRLKELGYDPGKLDGIYGAKTVLAVAKFQGDHNIKLEEKEEPGETASREMLELLFAPDPEPTPGETNTPEPTATAKPDPTATTKPDPTAAPTPATQTDLH